jgi:hypothetical protein
VGRSGQVHAPLRTGLLRPLTRLAKASAAVRAMEPWRWETRETLCPCALPFAERDGASTQLNQLGRWSAVSWAAPDLTLPPICPHPTQLHPHGTQQATRNHSYPL